MMEAKLKPFLTRVPEKILMSDLDFFRKKAMALEADGAEIIKANQLVIDERVRLKCTIPRCLRAGETPNCPPNVPDLDFVRKAFAGYSYALLLRTLVGPIEEYAPGHNKDRDGVDRTLLFHLKTSKIIYEIEKLAYQSGYYLAMGLGGGSCKDYLCHGQVCQYMDSGRCRFPHRSRPSMEAMGIDVFDIINKVGWDAYPLMDKREDLPCAISVGIVFIY